MAQAFYRKWRPQTWDEVVSQDHVIHTLRNAVRTGRTGHAYLLAGPRGTGKTTTARLLAKALNCLDPDLAKRPCDQCEHCQSVNEGRFLDLIEIDAASNTSVEDVRSLRDKINFSPTQGQYKVYIIDEVHMLSTAAFNALLKTLEEPPPHAVFVLATTEIHKIPATILSRCQRYEFRRIPVDEIKKHLKQKAGEEGLQVDEEALTLIARQATGAMRDAISLLDQLASTGERVTLAEAQIVLGTATSTMVVNLVEAVLAKDAGAGLLVIQSALDAGTDARQFARQVVDYLRSLLLVRMGNASQVDATAEMRRKITEHAQEFEPARLLEVIRLFNNAAVDSRSSWHPGLALELALAEAVEEKTEREDASGDAPKDAPREVAARKTEGSALRTEGKLTEKGVEEARRLAEGERGRPNPPAPFPRREGGEKREEQPAGQGPSELSKGQPAVEQSQAAGRALSQTGKGQPPVGQTQTAAAKSQTGVGQAQATGQGAPQQGKSQPPAGQGAPQQGKDQPPAGQAQAAGQGASQQGKSQPPTGEAQAASQGAPQQGKGQPPTGKAQPAPASQPGEGGKVVTQSEVQHGWQRVRQIVKSKNSLTAAALNSVRSFMLKDNVLILGFQTEVVKSKMETPENIDILRQALQSILGAPMGVRCIVVGSKGGQPADLDVDGDGMVGTALDLGGKIVFEE